MSWERVKLKELLTIKNGKDHKSLKDGIYPVYGSGGIMRYADKYLYDKESILLPRKGTLNNIQFARTPFWTVDTCYYTVVNTDRVVPYFLYRNLRQFDIEALNTGSAVPSMTFDKYYTIEINLPDLPTQKRIASILSAYDDLIEVNRKQIKLLEEAAERLYREWFIDLRFPGHETATFNADGLPEGWERKRLGEILGKLESGSRPKGGIDSSIEKGVASVGAENVIGLGQYNYTSDKLVSHEFYAKVKRGKIENKDILIYKDGAYIGRTSLFQDDFPHKEAMVNEHVFLLHAAKEIHQYFVFFTLHQQLYFEKMQKLNKNAAQPGINQDAIKSLDLIMPSDELLAQFDNSVTPFVAKIFALANQNREAAAARDLLLPRLMNGEIQL